MPNMLVTGGAGFIGSHVAERLIEQFPEAGVTIFDKMTYSADQENLAGILKRGQRRLVVGDVCDFDMCSRLTRGIDWVVHLAAESHVDNAFGNSLQFTRSNILGTHTLLEACRLNAVPLVIHVSTDEVYGEIREGAFDEENILNPTNPYSASKAGAEMIVNSYRYSFKLPIITVRANNIFGIRQYPEKIIPKFCVQALAGRMLTVHGNGENRRHYLAVEDFADALVLLLRKGQVGEIYNVGSDEEYSNLEVAEMICGYFGKNVRNSIEFVADRAFNDIRYATDSSKIGSLGWRPHRFLKDHIGEIAEWYRANLHRYIDLFKAWSEQRSEIAV